MFESDDNRARRGAGAPQPPQAARPAPGIAVPDEQLTAAERHKRARRAREEASRRAAPEQPRPNPILAGLAERRDEPAPAPETSAAYAAEPEPRYEARYEPSAAAPVPPHAAPEPRLAAPYPAQAPAAASDPEIYRPLIDPMVVIRTVWAWRLPIAALTGAGLVLGAIVAVSTPHRYTAYAKIFVDPREVKLVGQDISPDYLANEAALAIVDSQLQLVRTIPVLEKVVDRAHLDEDPEFNGTAEAGGLLGSLKGFAAIFSGGDTPEEKDRAAIQTLRDNLWVERSARTFVVNVGVTARDPGKSAEIANEIAQAFIEEQEKLKSDSARSASNALTSRLQTLRGDVERAERALQDYKAQNGLIGPAGRLVTDDQLSAVTSQLAEAKAATIAAKTRADAARAANLDVVVSGGLPQDLTSPALVALRAQYSTQRQQVAALENALGPRHPRLNDAKASLTSLQTEIAAELRRIVAGTQADLRRAVENEQALAASLAQLKSASANDNDAAVGQRELEREADSARQVYESFLLRARETGEIEALGTTNLKIISPAEVPDSPSSLSRKIIVAGYGAAGFALGLGLAFLAALREIFFSGGTQGPGAGSTRRRRGKADEPYAPGTVDPAAVTAAVRMSTAGAPAMQASVDMAPFDRRSPHDPEIRPACGQAAWQPWPVAPSYGWTPIQQQPVPPSMPAARDEVELDDLRRSVREIRATVDALLKKRTDRRRKVA